MRRGKAVHQKSMQMELPLEGRGEAPGAERSGEAGRVAQGKERSGSEHRLLMERVVARENAVEALKRVRRNKGSPGIDEWKRRNWSHTCANTGRRSESNCSRGPTGRAQ